MVSKKQKSGQPNPEEEEFEYRDVQWKDFVTKPKYIPLWIVALVVIALSAVIVIRHDEVVNAIRPASEKIRDLPAGFLIPIIILIIISFPPLFGHEIIALLCGVVYGLWIGFAVVAAGTFLGEKVVQLGHGTLSSTLLEEKPSNSNARISTTAHWHASPETVDFWYPSSNPIPTQTLTISSKVVLIVRFSVIPSHFSTAVFSTCNVKFWYFAIATFATLPKQIILVYVGVLFAQKNKNNTINDIVLVITFLVTVAAGAYIYNKMRLNKRILLDEQAARLDAKQRNVSQEFELNADVREGDDQWQRERLPDSPGYVRPPTQAKWTEETHEMGDMGRHKAQPQEFI
ncbi:Golgi apparatus membrane protein [Lachnellula subtilissima]|uniref:Golgi apparatus membrane protein n=1 Tax=Lachnellula subtilissima TaxID=602034 RepID=A0A8H8RWY5_9HELO|nr:Golgi apparatus membrane protein [Lachnellula subtilissima]